MPAMPAMLRPGFGLPNLRRNVCPHFYMTGSRGAIRIRHRTSSRPSCARTRTRRVVSCAGASTWTRASSTSSPDARFNQCVFYEDELTREVSQPASRLRRTPRPPLSCAERSGTVESADANPSRAQADERSCASGRSPGTRRGGAGAGTSGKGSVLALALLGPSAPRDTGWARRRSRTSSPTANGSGWTRHPIPGRTLRTARRRHVLRPPIVSPRAHASRPNSRLLNPSCSPHSPRSAWTSRWWRSASAAAGRDERVGRWGGSG